VGICSGLEFSHQRCWYPKGKSGLLALGDLGGNRFGFFLGYLLAKSRMPS